MPILGPADAQTPDLPREDSGTLEWSQVVLP